MAQDNELQIIFGADTAPLRSEVKKATGIVDQFGNEVNSVANTASKGFEKVRQSFQKVPRVVNDLGSATKGLKTNSNSAALALNDLSRVAQDVPFGFIGIQNNINPLLESFRRLKAETGSTGGALKALAGSLTGFGGLGLALGVVTSAITIYQNGISGFNRKTKEAADHSKDLVDNLKSVDQVLDDARSSVEGELVKVRSLATILTDSNKAYKDRKNALDQLRQVNKDYFGDLTLEANSLKTLTSRVDEYTSALIAAAVVKGFEDDIKNVSKSIREQNKLLDIAKTRYDQAQKAKDNFGSLTTTSATGEERLKAGAGEIEAAVKRTERAFLDQRNVVEKLQTNYAELSTEMQNAVENAAKFKSVTGNPNGNSKKEVDLIQRRIDALEKLKSVTGLLKVEEIELANLRVKLLDRDSEKEGFNRGQRERFANKIWADLNEALKAKFQLPLAIVPTLKPISPGQLFGNIQLPSDFNKGIEEAIEGSGERLQQLSERYKKIIFKFGDDAKQAVGEALNALTTIPQTIGKGVENAFVGVAESFGKVLSEGGGIGKGLAAAAQTLLSVVGDILVEVGKKAVIASALVVGLKAALEKAFTAPQLGIVAGLALIAAGTAMKNFKFPSPKLAGGGVVLGPTNALIGESGPEMVVPLNRANQFIDGGSDWSGQVVFEIDGRKLRGVLQRTEASMRRF